MRQLKTDWPWNAPTSLSSSVRDLPLFVQASPYTLTRRSLDAAINCKLLTNYAAVLRTPLLVFRGLPFYVRLGRYKPLISRLRSDVERIANSQKCCECDVASCLNLLPMVSQFP